jgi:endonuclease/exonuclease/phosphatase (EEP) superfamily protein YafD
MPVAHHNTSKASAPLKCLQINLRHSRCAALNLSQLILDLDIDVILIQEPYAAIPPPSLLRLSLNSFPLATLLSTVSLPSMLSAP